MIGDIQSLPSGMKQPNITVDYSTTLTADSNMPDIMSKNNSSQLQSSQLQASQLQTSLVQTNPLQVHNHKHNKSVMNSESPLLDKNHLSVDYTPQFAGNMKTGSTKATATGTGKSPNKIKMALEQSDM